MCEVLVVVNGPQEDKWVYVQWLVPGDGCFGSPLLCCLPVRFVFFSLFLRIPFALRTDLPAVTWNGMGCEWMEWDDMGQGGMGWDGMATWGAPASSHRQEIKRDVME